MVSTDRGDLLVRGALAVEVGIAAVLLGGGVYHYLQTGDAILPAALLALTGVLQFGAVGYLLGGDVSPSVYPVTATGTALGALALGGGTLAVALVAGGSSSLATGAPAIGILAGVGSLGGFTVGLQSARRLEATARADRAETAAQRLSEERSRFVVLNRTTRSLLDAPDREAVTERLIAEGRVGLPGPFAGVWLHDADRDRLVPAAATSTDANWTPQQLWPDSEAMAVFEDGSPLTIGGEGFPDVGPLYAVPIGRHGVLVVGVSQAFDEKARNLVEVYALTAEAAMNRIEHERELQRQNDRLDSFASVVVHDLRNPLNVVRGRARLTEQTGDTEHLDRVFESLDRMEAIIGDVLALARGGNEEYETESVTLTPLVERSWAQVETREATLDVGVLHSAQGDETRLARLFENLFRNAVEHGGDDVTVSVGMLADENGFFVADDGPGIPPDERETVLQEGYSGSDGTGIGLAVVKQVAEAHGWSVAVTESESGGARFEFRF